MRYLNKVSFINSAMVKYAEIDLNGNVHFIGTQGVGKSTLLRAILFFYNANALKLGVPSGPSNKSFGEWYFPYTNSYIIYEVQRGTGAYCILAFKAQNRVCYYFIDAPYDRNQFIDADGKAFDSWDKIRSRLDANQVFYSRRIKSYDEYRDILYGNDQGKKEFRRYALLESRQYLNIPRTIQNVFLNAKLDAEFIKQTIIDSMSEENLQIDLQSYTHHLKDFETQLNDISQFRQPAVQKQAHKASQLYVTIKQLQKEARQLVGNLKGALAAAKATEPQLIATLRTATSQKAALVTSNTKSAASYQRRKDKITADISVFNDRLKTARTKEEGYNKLNIEDLISRVNARSQLEQQQQNLMSEKNLLGGQFQELSQKYAALLTELDNQQHSLTNLREAEKLKLKEQLVEQRDAIRCQYEKLLEEIRQQHKAEVDSARVEAERLQHMTYQLKNKQIAIKHKLLYEEEIKQKKDQLKQLEHDLIQAKNHQQINTDRLTALKREQELEEQALTAVAKHQSEQGQKHCEQLQQKIEQISHKLKADDDSLYGWLNQHHSDWEETIGKVCAEEVLFDDSLRPRKATSMAGFYGVELDLSQRPRLDRSLAHYQHERALLEQSLKQEQDKEQHLAGQHEEKLQKLQQRLQPKARALKEHNRELDYAISQNPHKRETLQLALDQFEKKARQEKQSALAELTTTLATTVKEQHQAQDKLDRLETLLKRRLKAKERERDQKIAHQVQVSEHQRLKIDEQLAENQRDFHQRRETIRQQRSQELASKGADTSRLDQIEQELMRARVELEFIEKNRDQVAEYYQDKRELFDRVKQFKNQRQLLAQELEQKQLEFEQLQRTQQQELAELNTDISQWRAELDQLKADLEEFERFKLSEVYQTLASELATAPELEQNKGCRMIIDELKENYYAGMRRQNNLKESVDNFLGHFSAANVFKFETHLSTLDSYLQFSCELTEFIEEDKIAEFEKRINERFADIVTGIGKETTGLLSRTSEIQKVISKINRDFTQKNFVGAIRKIELKLDESANSVFVVLKQIKEFNDRHALDFGARNLFSSQNSDINNHKAVDLLKLLIKEIGRSKNTLMSLSDSFELKFRVEENQNDTGWVEKLANVGSDGTDVLVKAMVNIMLLNVFKEGASRRFKDFRLHCMMDEIGKLHPNNVRGILKFANDRNIMLINGSPTENNALNYRHIYKMSKDTQGMTRVTRILSNTSPL